MRTITLADVFVMLMNLPTLLVLITEREWRSVRPGRGGQHVSILPALLTGPPRAGRTGDAAPATSSERTGRGSYINGVRGEINIWL